MQYTCPYSFILFSRQVEMAMYRSRCRVQPQVPTSAADLITSLMDPAGSSYNYYFKAHVSAKGQTAVILFSDLVKEKLHEVGEAFYDGTFFCVLSIFEQLFTISGVVGSHPLPLVHVLMTGRKESLYSVKSWTNFLNYPLLSLFPSGWTILKPQAKSLSKVDSQTTGWQSVISISRGQSSKCCKSLALVPTSNPSLR